MGNMGRRSAGFACKRKQSLHSIGASCSRYFMRTPKRTLFLAKFLVREKHESCPDVALVSHLAAGRRAARSIFSGIIKKLFKNLNDRLSCNNFGLGGLAVVLDEFNRRAMAVVMSSF